MATEFNVEAVLEFERVGNQVKIIKSKIKGPIICQTPSVKSIISELLMTGYLLTNQVSVDLSLEYPLVFDTRGQPIFVLYPMN